MKKFKVYAGKVNRRKVVPVTQDEIKSDLWRDFDGNLVNTEHMMISLLLPPAVKEFYRHLDSEVQTLCGGRHAQGTPMQRWGCQPGSVIIADHKVRIEKPRVRDSESKKEIALKTYQDFQNPEMFDESVFRDGMRKVSQRDYEEGVRKISSSFGFTKSSVSRRWIKTTEKMLKELNERDISKLKIIAVLIDGKRMRDHGVIIALGVAEDGKKHVLGIYESNSESSEACNSLLSDLERRGMPSREILFVVDGGSGLNKSLEERYRVHDPKTRVAVRVRCFFHKWMNISKDLSDDVRAKAAGLYWGIRDASRPDIAINCADALESLLHENNLSALKSFLEAKEDLLVIHRLRLSPGLKKFFSTTNAIESLNSLIEEDLRRVKHWQDSNHFQRWLATACIENEKRMRRIHGFQNLPALKAALSDLCFGKREEEFLDKVAVNG